MLPEYAQARKAIWNAVNPHTERRRIDEVFPSELIATRNEQEMFIRFKNGSTWQVVGSDTYNALVGTPPVGITFSEWALANPTAWAYLSPILAENGGWASFITTPRGNNHAKKMYDAMRGRPGWFCQVLGVDDTHAIPLDVIEDQRASYVGLYGPEIADLLIAQEFYCSFSGALVGSYYAPLLDAAEKDGRIGDYPRVDGPVHTAWDLGIGDDTALWCFQVVGGAPRIIDCYSANGVGAEHYVDWLKSKGYNGMDFMPHDARAREWGTGRTRIETVQSMGRTIRIAPEASVEDGIQAGRKTLSIARFNAATTSGGIDALRDYRREWDDDNKVFKRKPLHDWTSHYADAWRYLSLAWREQVAQKKPEPKKDRLIYDAKPDGRMVANMSIRDIIEAKRRKRERM